MIKALTCKCTGKSFIFRKEKYIEKDLFKGAIKRIRGLCVSVKEVLSNVIGTVDRFV